MATVKPIPEWLKLDSEKCPMARQGHSLDRFLVSDKISELTGVQRGTEALMLFGGCDGSQVFSDVWLFHAARDTKHAQWVKLHVNGSISPRFRHTSCVIANASALYVFGGYSGQERFNDLHFLDLNTLRWQEIVFPMQEQPSSSILFCCCEASPGKLFFFGGKTSRSGTGSDDKIEQFVFDCTTRDLKRVHFKDPPSSRAFHTCDSVDRTESDCDFDVILYGGFDGLQAFDDVYTLDLRTEKWSLRSTRNAPSGRYKHDSAVLFGCLCVFGGYTTRWVQDALFLNLATLSWMINPEIAGESPEPREGHTLTVLSDHLIVYGGWSWPISFSDVHVLQNARNLLCKSPDMHAATKRPLRSRLPGRLRVLDPDPASPSTPGSAPMLLRKSMPFPGPSADIGGPTTAPHRRERLLSSWDDERFDPLMRRSPAVSYSPQRPLRRRSLPPTHSPSTRQAFMTAVDVRDSYGGDPLPQTPVLSKSSEMWRDDSPRTLRPIGSASVEVASKANTSLAIRALRSSVSLLKETVEEKRQHLRENDRQMAELRSQVEKTRARLKELQQKCVAQDKGQKELEEKLNRSEERLVSKEAERLSAEGTTVRLTAAVSSLTDQLSELDTKLETTESQARETAKNISKATANIVAAQLRRQEEESKCVQLNSEVALLKSQASKHSSVRKDSERELKQLLQNIEEVERQFTEMGIAIDPGYRRRFSGTYLTLPPSAFGTS